ncbi:MAG: hypothetical protein HC811_13170, partial [Flammeovirgaceae bacterium]|nr:hypothetical protein [Flammeovirgaceae bacterium]
LYNEMAEELKSKWNDDLDNTELSEFETVSQRSNSTYTDYKYAQSTHDGIIALKSGIGDIEKFVLLKDGLERKVFTPGPVNDAGMLSVANGKWCGMSFGMTRAGECEVIP